MDEINPQARVAIGEEMSFKPGPLFFKGNTITVADQKEDSLLIEAIAHRRAAYFKIKIDYRVDGKPGSIVIDNHGLPFSVTGINCTKMGRPFGEGESSPMGIASYNEVWFNNNFQSFDHPPNPRSYKTWLCSP
jgi:hypothetical protein